MLGGLDVDDHIAAATHVDDFAVDSKRMPVGIKPLVVAFAIELLRIEILHIGQQRGVAPRNMLVVPGNDEGHSGERDACDVEAGRAQVGHVPGVGHAEREVHVV